MEKVDAKTLRFGRFFMQKINEEKNPLIHQPSLGKLEIGFQQKSGGARGAKGEIGKK
jgi:hypothetical protein